MIAHKTTFEGIVREWVLARTRVRSIVVWTIRWADEWRGIRLANTHCEQRGEMLLSVLQTVFFAWKNCIFRRR